jgi:hypothetical protein
MSELGQLRNTRREHIFSALLSNPEILAAGKCLPVFAQQRTCSDHGDTSDLCQKRKCGSPWMRGAP